MSKKTILSFTVLTVILLTGCQTPPPLDFTLANVSVVINRQDVELRSITVGYASQKEQTQVDTSYQIPPIWKSGLEDAINRSLIFKDDAEKKVSISVRIFEFDVPFAGFAMVTTTGAIYEITDRDSGEIVFSERLSTSGRVEANEAFSGLTRAMESANKAVRNNIQKFIDAAEQANL